jgi:hypothetical protein
LETFGAFDPWAVFLGQAFTVQKTVQKRYHVSYNTQNQLQIALGAVHGFQPDALSQVPVRLYTKRSGGTLLAETTIQRIGISESFLEPVDFPEGVLNLWGEVHFWIPPLFIYTDSAEAQNVCQAIQEVVPNTFIVSTKEENCAHVRLSMTNNFIHLTEADSGRFLIGVSQTEAASSSFIHFCLERIARWYRAKVMYNRYSRLLLRDFFCSLEIKSRNNWDIASEDSIAVPYYGQNIKIRIRAHSTGGQVMHVLLVYLSPDYGMEIITSEKIPPHKESVLLERNFYLPPGVQEETDHLLLLMSDSAIRAIGFSQPDLPIGKNVSNVSGNTRRWRGLDEEEDLPQANWQSRLFKIKIFRKQIYNSE